MTNKMKKRRNKPMHTIDTFLFDLDGTLLPMPSQEQFIDVYANTLKEKLSPYGDTKILTNAVLSGIKAMIDNDGSMTNEKRFWSVFCKISGKKDRDLLPVFLDYYKNEFQLARSATSVNPLAKECIGLLKEKGYCLVLATNPLFPKVATYSRIRWANLSANDFIHITTYENSSFCKPNLSYYEEILRMINKSPDQCIMVGNDVKEDMCANSLGMDTFLLKDNIINKEEADITRYKQGGFKELLEFIKNLDKELAF
jgi:FMN phosphatase YigB (HAD superfamily)